MYGHSEYARCGLDEVAQLEQLGIEVLAVESAIASSHVSRVAAIDLSAPMSSPSRCEYAT